MSMPGGGGGVGEVLPPHPPQQPQEAARYMLEEVQRLREGLAMRGEAHMVRDARGIEASLRQMLGPTEAPQPRIPHALQAQLRGMMDQMQEQMEETARVLSQAPTRSVRDRNLEAELDEMKREMALSRVEESPDNEMKKMEQEMSRLRQQQEVSKLRLQIQKEQEEWARQAAEERRREDEAEARRLWEAEQRSAPKKDTTAALDMKGFIVFFDRATGLPGKNTPLAHGWPGSEIRLVYSFFENGNQLFPLKELPPCGVQQDTVHPTFKLCNLQQRKKITGIELVQDVSLLIEVQLVIKHATEPGADVEYTPHAWTLIPITDRRETLLEGSWKAPLFFCPVDPSASPHIMDDTFKRIETHNSTNNTTARTRHQCYVRLVQPKNVAAELGRGTAGDSAYKVPRIYKEVDREVRALMRASGEQDESSESSSEEEEEDHTPVRKKPKKSPKRSLRPDVEEEPQQTPEKNEEAPQAEEEPPLDTVPPRKESVRRSSMRRVKSVVVDGVEVEVEEEVQVEVEEQGAAPEEVARRASSSLLERSARAPTETAVPALSRAPTASALSRARTAVPPSVHSTPEGLRPPSVDFSCATEIQVLELNLPEAAKCSAVKVTCSVCTAGDIMEKAVTWVVDTVTVRPKQGSVCYKWRDAPSRTLPHQADAVLLFEVWTGHSLSFAEKLTRWGVASGADLQAETPTTVVLGARQLPVCTTNTTSLGYIRVKLCRSNANSREAHKGYSNCAHPKEAAPTEVLWERHQGRSSKETATASTNVYVRIDKARFLPANVCVSRVVVRFFGRAKKSRTFVPVGEGLDVAVQDIESNVAHPFYTASLGNEQDGYHAKLSGMAMQKVADVFCLLDVEVIDACMGKPAVLGYAILPVYADGVVHTQRVQARLRVGPLPPKPVTPQMLDAAPYFPLATLLVTVMCRIPPPPEEYASGVFDTTQARPAASEQVMFRTFDHQPRFVRTTLAAKLPSKASARTVREKVEKLFGSAETMPTRLVDPSFVSRFNAKTGAGVHVSAATGLPQGKDFLYKVVTTLHPQRVMWYTQRSDWSASSAAPRWADETHIVKNVPLTSESVVFMEVVKVSYAGVVTHHAWGALPLMQRGGSYAQHGKFRIPLYKGGVSDQHLSALKESSVEAFLAGRDDKDLAKWSTLIVSLTDGLRHEELRSDAVKPRNMLDPKHATQYAQPTASPANLRSTLTKGIDEVEGENITNQVLEEKTGARANLVPVKKVRINPKRESIKEAEPAVQEEEPPPKPEEKPKAKEEVPEEKPPPPRVRKTLSITKSDTGKVGVKYTGKTVTGVVPGGACDTAGVQVGMMLEEIAGHTLQDTTEAVRTAFGAAPTSFNVIVSMSPE